MKIMLDDGQTIEGEVKDFDTYYNEVEKIYLSSDNPDDWGLREKEHEKDFILIQIRKEV